MMSGLLPLLAPRTSTMPNSTCACSDALDRCGRCDLLLGFPSLHLVAVTQAPTGLVLEAESCDPVTGCPGCGVIATGHGRVAVELIDAPGAGRPVRIRWRKRRWICPEDRCEVTTFIEQDPEVCAPRGLLSTRAIRWAISQLRREAATIQGLARQLGATWNTLWAQIQPVLAQAAGDPSRFEDVRVIGVDEHIWHHRDRRRRGAKELTGIVDLTRGPTPPPGCWIWSRADPPRPTATGWTSAARRSATGSRSRHWTRSRATRTRSMTSSKTQPACRTLSTSSSSAQLLSMTCAAASSKRPSSTEDARVTRSTASVTFSEPGANASHLASRLVWPERSLRTRIMSPSRSPTSAPRTCETSSTSPRPLRAGDWPSG